MLPERSDVRSVRSFIGGIVMSVRGKLRKVELPIVACEVQRSAIWTAELEELGWAKRHGLGSAIDLEMSLKVRDLDVLSCGACVLSLDSSVPSR